MSLCFRSLDLKIKSYVDVDLAGEVDNSKNIIMFIYTLGNTNMCWALKLQNIIAQSIIEVEYKCNLSC